MIIIIRINTISTKQHILDYGQTKHFRGGYIKNTVILVGWLSYIWMLFLRWIVSIQRRYMYVLCVAFGFGFRIRLLEYRCFVFCFVLFCFVLFCFVLFCFVLFCFVLFCFVLFCFVLF